MNHRALPALILFAAPLLAGAAALAQGSAGLSAALVAGPPDLAHGAVLAETCATCHSPTSRAPVLKGESAALIQEALVAYRSGARRGGPMPGVAARLSDQDIVDVAAFYAGTPASAAATPPAAATPTPAEPAAATPAAPTPAAKAAPDGQMMYLEGDPARDLLACAVCHGEDGRGADAVGIPAIAGRSAQEVLATLKTYHVMPAVGIAYPDAMRIAVKPLSEADMQAVATFVSTLK
ncbi:c-type cytochrome [Deinococcus radiotolerans]|uniref:Cytochrome c n=1 Tax=Deinococcus radiotolerans TaxID=1309407 RepID=A0ABQ2FGY2_9DEIO|nr:c-type cytochrome [Deinococcus radiotolerans]GGK93969.1 cytochrome c [Deinococcus radiotolerans]